MRIEYLILACDMIQTIFVVLAAYALYKSRNLLSLFAYMEM